MGDGCGFHGRGARDEAVEPAAGAATVERARRARRWWEAVSSLSAFAKGLAVPVLAAASAVTAAQPPSAFQDRSTQPSAQVNPQELSNVGIDQRLDQQLPLELAFRDETGNSVKLGDYFHSGRPVILNMVYYTCPMLCGEELAGEASALGVLRFTPGNEYEVVSVSFNPD